MSRTVNMRLTFAAQFLLVLSGAMAQLLNCAEIPDCPMSTSTISACRVEDTLMSAVGVANFSTNLTSSPLTWTVAYTQKNTAYATQRKYYLGYPPELDLQAIPSTSSCALFFTGIEAGLSFLGDGDSRRKGSTAGTCDDALGANCTASLLQQAQMLANRAPDCATLASMLQNSPPSACTQAGNWGDIIAMPLNSSTPIQTENCHPTINSTYELASVASFPELFDHDYFNDITPLLTVFMPLSSNVTNTTTSPLSEPEVHLNCMKPLNVESQATVTKSGSEREKVLGSALVTFAIGLQILMALL